MSYTHDPLTMICGTTLRVSYRLNCTHNAHMMTRGITLRVSCGMNCTLDAHTVIRRNPELDFCPCQQQPSALPLLSRNPHPHVRVAPICGWGIRPEPTLLLNPTGPFFRLARPLSLSPRAGAAHLPFALRRRIWVRSGLPHNENTTSNAYYMGLFSADPCQVVWPFSVTLSLSSVRQNTTWAKRWCAQETTPPPSASRTHERASWAKRWCAQETTPPRPPLPLAHTNEHATPFSVV